jgi:hypothetical protein
MSLPSVAWRPGDQLWSLAPPNIQPRPAKTANQVIALTRTILLGSTLLGLV